MKRFRLSMESLETRETPSGLASVTDLVVDSYNPTATSDGFYGTGVYKSVDGGQTWANDGVSGRVTGVAVDPSDPSAARHRMFALVDRTQLLGNNDSIWIDIGAPAQANEAARYFNGIVGRMSAGDMVLKGSKIGENALVGANETITIGGAQTEDVASARPTILLQRLANPGLPDETAATKSGSVYTITFGGSLVG